MTDDERALLGSLLHDPRKVCEVSIGSHNLTDRAGEILATIQRLDRKGVEPDIVSVSAELKHIPPAEIALLTSTVSTASNFDYYEGRVKESWTRRKLAALGELLLHSKEPIDTLMASLDRELVEIAGTSGRRPVATVSSQMLGFIETLERRCNLKGEMPGIKCGIEGLDIVTLGLQKGLLYVIGARPSCGKSALMLNMAAHIAYKERRKVGVLSLESGSNEVLARMVSSMGHVSSKNIKAGLLSAGDKQKIMETCATIHGVDTMYIWDQPNAKLTDVVSVCRQMVRKGGCEVLFLDYAQIVRVPGAQDRRQAAEETSMTMKEIARDLQVPVVMAAQLKRDSDGRRPTFADFQWTSQFEQDADVAALIHHEYAGDDPYKIERSWLLADKVRDGGKTAIPLVFKGEYVSFYGTQQETRV